MRKTLLITLILLSQFAFGQSLQFAKQFVPFKLNKDEQFHFLQKDSFVHAWTFNGNTLSLHLFNRELEPISTQRLHKKAAISGSPFFKLSFPNFYYVVLPLEKSSKVYRVAANGDWQLVGGAEVPLKLGRVKYVEKIGEKIFVTEEVETQKGTTLSALQEFDAEFRPSGKKYLLNEANKGQSATLYFKAIDDSTFVTGKIETQEGHSSTLFVTRLNTVSGQKEEKKFTSESSEWSYIRLLSDDNKNLYIVNQVSAFPKDAQITLRKETSYITKINTAWEVENSISLEGPIRMDSSRQISLQNTHSFFANGLLLTVSQWTTGLSFDGLTYRVNQPNNTKAPESASTEFGKQLIATALSAAPRHDRPGANNPYLDVNRETVNEYSSSGRGGYLPTYSYQSPDYWKMPVKEYQNFSVIDNSLSQIHPKTIDYPAADAFFIKDKKLLGVYLKNQKLGYYELHHSEGAKGLQEIDLNPDFEYLPWKITQLDVLTYLLPYVYKNHLYFARLSLPQ